MTKAPTEGRSRLSILVGIEPRSYRDTIGTVIDALRPGLEVTVVEPENLLQEVDGLGPSVVLCSRPEPHEQEGAASWVEFYPYAKKQRVKIRIGRHRSVQEDADLNDLLALVDEAAYSY